MARETAREVADWLETYMAASAPGQEGERFTLAIARLRDGSWRAR